MFLIKCENSTALLLQKSSLSWYRDRMPYKTVPQDHSRRKWADLFAMFVQLNNALTLISNAMQFTSIVEKIFLKLSVEIQSLRFVFKFDFEHTSHDRSFSLRSTNTTRTVYALLLVHSCDTFSVYMTV